MSNSVDQDILFVCGAARSGTTLLRLMLKHHPQIANPGEMDFMFECPLRVDGKPDVERYWQELSLNRIFLASGLSVDKSLGHADLVRSFAEGVRTPGQILSINIHRHFERIPEIFPNARFIHLVRDPRDVARSSIGMAWAGNTYHGVGHWIGAERSFDALKAIVSGKKIYEFKNEDLISDPAAELTKLCAFIGVPYDPAMLTYPENSTYDAPDPSLINQWKRLQSEREVALVEGKVGSMLTDRGYEPSGYAPIIPGAIERFKLAMDNRFRRLNILGKRYGYGLTGLDILARRLPFLGLRPSVQRALNKKSVQYLK